MAKEKVELLDELKQGVARATLVGKANIKENSLGGEKLKEGSTWKHVDSSFSIGTGEGNSVWARIWGGYKIDKPVLKRWNNDNEFIDVAWANRLDEKVISSIRDNELFHAGLEKDESGRTVVKSFISEIDFEEYLREHLADGTEVKVFADAEWSNYKDNTSARYNIKSVYLNEGYTKSDGTVVEPAPHGAELTQTFLLDSDSLDKKWEKELEKEGAIYVSAAIPQYTSQRKVGDKWVELKKTIPLSTAFSVKMKDKTDEKELKNKKTIIKKLFKVEKDKVREISLVIDIIEGYDQASGDIEINQEMRDLIEMGVFTEEDIKKQVTIRGTKVSELAFKKPQVELEDGEIHLKFTDEKYSPAALIMPFVDGEEDDDDYEDNDSEDDDETVVSDDEFASLFG